MPNLYLHEKSLKRQFHNDSKEKKFFTRHRVVTGDEQGFTTISQGLRYFGNRLAMVRQRILMDKTHILYFLRLAWCRVL